VSMVNRREVDKVVFCFDRAKRCVVVAAWLAERSFRLSIAAPFAGRSFLCAADVASLAGRSFLCDARSSSPIKVFLLALFLADVSSGGSRYAVDFEVDAISFVRTRCVVLLCLIPKGPALGPDGSTIRVMIRVADEAMSVEAKHFVSDCHFSSHELNESVQCQAMSQTRQGHIATQPASCFSVKKPSSFSISFMSA
jgi:hypothetical protein